MTDSDTEQKRKRKNHKKKYQQTEKVRKEIRRELELERKWGHNKREKNRKTKIYQKYVYRGDTNINKMKK